MIREPLLTSILARDDLQLSHTDVYLYGRGVEDRSVLDSPWRDEMTRRGAQFVEVVEDFAPSEIELRLPQGSVNIATRNPSEIVGYFESHPDGQRFFLDITGMAYSSWAPLLKGAIDSQRSFDVIYVEPAHYRRSNSQANGMQFELSEGFSEIGPLPGLTRLRRFSDQNWLLVALLGFEGSRFAHVMNELEVPRDSVVPVIGLPGFRPEFATTALIANRSTLDDMAIAGKLRYATANCPFDTFQTLRAIHDDFPDRGLRLAPIGTKPHGLGAVLYGISRMDDVQVLYDHPTRKAQRTIGKARLCRYSVSVFCESDLFRRKGEYA